MSTNSKCPLGSGHLEELDIYVRSKYNAPFNYAQGHPEHKGVEG